MSNKTAKEKLIEQYGAECFIEKLHLRVDTKPRKYTSKGQMKRMRQLTYHHILEKSKGGKATVENGALLSFENHMWFNKQPKKTQAQMNEIFQEYKHSVDCKVEFVDDLQMSFEIATAIIEPQELAKYNRARENRKWRKEMERGDD